MNFKSNFTFFWHLLFVENKIFIHQHCKVDWRVPTKLISKYRKCEFWWRQGGSWLSFVFVCVCAGNKGMSFDCDRCGVVVSASSNCPSDSEGKSIEGRGNECTLCHAKFCDECAALPIHQNMCSEGTCHSFTIPPSLSLHPHHSSSPSTSSFSPGRVKLHSSSKSEIQGIQRQKIGHRSTDSVCRKSLSRNTGKTLHTFIHSPRHTNCTSPLNPALSSTPNQNEKGKVSDFEKNLSILIHLILFRRVEFWKIKNLQHPNNQKGELFLNYEYLSEFLHSLKGGLKLMEQRRTMLHHKKCCSN